LDPKIDEAAGLITMCVEGAVKETVAAAESSGEIVREKEDAGAPASSSYQTRISVQKRTIFQMILTSVESRIETISRICPFSLNVYVPGLRGN
jgi:hypothetical protein